MFGCLHRHTFNHTGCVTRDAIIYVRPRRFKSRSVTPRTRQPSRKDLPVTPPDPIYKQPYTSTRNAKRPFLVEATTDLGFLWSEPLTRQPTPLLSTVCNTLESIQNLATSPKELVFFPPCLSPPGGWFGSSIYLFIFFQPPSGHIQYGGGTSLKHST